MGTVTDPRFGPGYPNCALNKGRVEVTLDFGLGAKFTTEFHTGAAGPLVRAVAAIRAINEDDSPRSYRVHTAGHNQSRSAYDVDIAGTYACRPINNPSAPGSETPSTHSWPVAIDINPPENGFDDGRGDIPDWFAQCFLDEGFVWGLDWGDAMHFEHTEWTGEWDGTYPAEEDEDVDRKKVLEGVNRRVNHDGAPGKDTHEDLRFGYHLADKILDAAKVELAKVARAKG